MQFRAILAVLGATALAACGGGGDRESAAAGRDTARADAAPATQNQPPAAATPVSGPQVYGRTCITCHQANGRGTPGVFPPLAGSPFATGGKARLIRLVLNGMTGPLTVEGTRYNGVMPPWKGQLTDAEVAAVLTYVRSSFGNTADAVTEAEVGEQRAATASRSTPFTAAELERP